MGKDRGRYTRPKQEFRTAEYFYRTPSGHSMEARVSSVESKTYVLSVWWPLVPTLLLMLQLSPDDKPSLELQALQRLSKMLESLVLHALHAWEGMQTLRACQHLPMTDQLLGLYMATTRESSLASSQ